MKVTLVIDDNCDSNGIKENVILPLGSSSGGAICRHVFEYALSQHAAEIGACGERHMPCYGQNLCDAASYQEDSLETTSTCRDELICAPSGQNEQRICYQPCETDDDCPLPDVLSCQDNLCRLSKIW